LRGGRERVKPGFLGWIVVFGSVVALTAIPALGLGREETSGVLRVIWAIPIAIAAVQFGFRGGLTSAICALALVIVYEGTVAQEPSLAILLATGSVYLAVGGLLGRFVDERRALEATLEHHYALSLDLIATGNFDGYFENLNPAWEETLGYTVEQLCSRPIVEFIHPDDREMSILQGDSLANGIKTVSFRNRYRTADGDYRWLEWNVHPDPDARRLYGMARDISAQKEAEDAFQKQSEQLEQTIRDRTKALEASRLEVLQRLAIAAEYRDDDTNQHTERVGRTAARIARRLGLSEKDVKLIRRAAPLHDIGKVGVPDAVLLKRGELTEDEYEAMQEHVQIGASILAQGQFAILNVARAIALSHHERWDGSGYPYGLKGADIPLVGRITAVADVFDALTHERPYKPAWKTDAAVAEIEKNAGVHFDPEVVEAFLALEHSRLRHPVGGLRPANWGRPREVAPTAATSVDRVAHS
jgi:PAS domain S-box-containing protein/putative nucleotidyltransferase with HDIG domain